jgi:predicted SprT family Zn-dependent metalloprotease
VPSPTGRLGDDHALSEWARRYANGVLRGDRWPLTADHVDLEGVTFETSHRMKRQHGVCTADGTGQCTIRLAETTYDRAGREATEETVRHELVHAYQLQTAGLEAGHGDSFARWVERLDLSGRCSRHYESRPEDFRYRFHCEEGCGFVGGRHRWSAVVRRAIRGEAVCGDCGGELRVDGPDGEVTEVPEERATSGRGEPVRTAAESAIDGGCATPCGGWSAGRCSVEGVTRGRSRREPEPERCSRLRTSERGSRGVPGSHSRHHPSTSGNGLDPRARKRERRGRTR